MLSLVKYIINYRIILNTVTNLQSLGPNWNVDDYNVVQTYHDFVDNIVFFRYLW